MYTGNPSTKYKITQQSFCTINSLIKTCKKVVTNAAVTVWVVYSDRKFGHTIILVYIVFALKTHHLILTIVKYQNRQVSFKNEIYTYFLCMRHSNSGHKLFHQKIVFLIFLEMLKVIIAYLC